jgi:hypothetical protein
MLSLESGSELKEETRMIWFRKRYLVETSIHVSSEHILVLLDTLYLFLRGVYVIVVLIARTAT